MTADRVDPPLRADERTSLVAFLDYHRATFLAKLDGLTDDQLRMRVGASSLSLGNLAKHLALVEDSWFQEDFLGVPMEEPWASAPFDDDRDWDFHSADADSGEYLRDLYRAACDRSRAAIADVDDLDALSKVTSKQDGQPFSLRWILLHMIEETARHNGHADLLREAIDGVTGE